MPKHIVEITLDALKSKGKNLKNTRIALLGTTYKADVDDSRQSPSEPIIRELLRVGADTIVYDPHCSETFGAKKAESIRTATKGADCLIILVDHTEFKDLRLSELKELMNDKPILIDGKRIINPYDAEKTGFLYCGIGFGKLREERI
jgi:UDP-N-acetyl-D-mannosaminuronate dehydrogenase